MAWKLVTHKPIFVKPKTHFFMGPRSIGWNGRTGRMARERAPRKAPGASRQSKGQKSHTCGASSMEQGQRSICLYFRYVQTEKRCGAFETRSKGKECNERKQIREEEAKCKCIFTPPISIFAQCFCIFAEHLCIFSQCIVFLARKNSLPM